MLVLPIWFSVVTDDPVGISGWRTLRIGWCNLSVKSIIKSLEQTISEFHVTNWVNIGKVYTSWKLTISVSPFVFDALHMELVYNNDNLLCLALINPSEEFLITFVDEDWLQPWEKHTRGLNEPVDLVRIKASLSVLTWFRVLHSSNIFPSLKVPESHILILKSPPDVLW